jgi:hypothetical protein
MDPDKALDELRGAIERVDAVYARLEKRAEYAQEHECDADWSYAWFDEKNADDREVIAEVAGTVIERARDLDEWMSRGGFPPKAWGGQ